MKGAFITIEGPDGSGKTTLIDHLKTWLTAKKIDVIATREPGGTQLGEVLRKILLDDHDHDHDHGDQHDANTRIRARISDQAELMLMFTARMQHLHEVILPAMAAGRCVLCDRFTDATYAYQGGGRGISERRIQQLEDWVQQGLQPDLTIMLDVPIEVGLQRTKKRGIMRSSGRPGGDRFEQQQLDFKEAVRQAYLRRAEKYPQRIKLIDATRSIGEVQDDLTAQVEAFLTAPRGARQG
ncbi:dTMP kinase [Candidatus Spongiihabitans sp.]|uniref:dTMP kinase n=1 Tax=Candidatus Spongiihabitans sp. TaxID=3101308 RepID=UPI003C7CAF19